MHHSKSIQSRVETIWNPGRFETLMVLYEENYIKLRRLAPDLYAMPTGSVLRIPGEVPLILEVSDRQKYTSTIRLTFEFEHEEGGVQLEPDLVIRIYHDARSAEAVLESSAGQFGVELKTPQKVEVSMQKRVEINRFLNRWLTYCLREGHQFSAMGHTVSCFTVLA
jgi:uncharacterized protein YqiB (DUF1249 family)